MDVWRYFDFTLRIVLFSGRFTDKEVNWTDFEKAALNGDIDKIMVFSEANTAEGFVNDEGAKKHHFDNSDSFNGDKKIKTTIPSSDKIQEKIDSWNAALAAEGKPQIKVNYEKGSDLMKLFWYFGPILILVIFMVYMSKRMSGGTSGGGIFSVGKSRATVFDKNNGSSVTFKDVAGLAEAKVEIEEIVEFLKNPQKIHRTGSKNSQRRVTCRPSGNRQDASCKSSCRGSQCAVPVNVWL